MKQLALLRQERQAYGGDLLKTRRGRAHARPLTTRGTKHLVLRSSRAKGEWSFRKPQNKARIENILTHFARKNGLRLLSTANVGNHLHLHVKLSTRHTYRAFIRAVTAAIAMAVTGASRWRPGEGKFWDRRPFSRVMRGLRSYLNVRDYIEVNQLEGLGYRRDEARFAVAWRNAGAG